MSENLNDKDVKELLELLDKLKSEAGFDSDMETESDDNDFESLMSLSFDDMDKEFIKNSKTKVLKVKRIHEDAVLPFYNYGSDSGFDLFSVEEFIMEPLSRALIPTGLSFEFDEGYEIQVRTKSGLAINQGLMVLNSPGTVDQGYSGEIKVPIFNASNQTIIVKKGMKVAQGVLCPVVNGNYVKVEEISDLSERDRGDKGFGSTGI